MRLRRQLLLVSLLTLSLPWAGCQYIQEMESALQQGQSSALTASAQAVAARLSSEPALIPGGGYIPLTQEIYAHPLPAAAIVDGYSDDWRGQAIDARRYTPADATTDFAVNLYTGTHGNSLYLFIDVDDHRINYHHPGKAALASGDHLLLARGRGEQPALVYTLRTSAPGSIAAVARNSRGQVYQEYRIRGFWRERGNGYQVELELPLAFANQGFGLSVVNQDDEQSPQILGSYLPNTKEARSRPATGRLVTRQAALSAELAIFTRPGLQLRVVDHHAWQLALAGSTENPVPASRSQTAPHWLLTSFYRAILKSAELPEHPEPAAQGRYDYSEVQQALNGHYGVNWYQLGQRQLGSAAVPIVADGRVLGAVIAEQSSDALLAMTNSAFTRLVLVSMGAALIAGLGLLGYASWLSWRIRRLSHAADRAVASDGQISDLQGHWPAAKARDEIGELSRSYRDLLLRLQAYTDYLKTLANKLSHELRTPLAVVRSSLDNLEHEPLPAQASVYTERARAGAERLSRLLTAMSEASRVESSIQSAERETFPLNELLENVCAAYRDIYPAHRIELTIAPHKNGYDFWGSPDLLAQSLDKLVDNAADYCPPGGEIRLQLRPAASNWEVRVENQGPLLPDNMREQLFDSLVSLREKDKKAKDDKTHMGLGLHIVRLVCHFHGGSVTAGNLADKRGVVFTLQLPRSSPA